MQIFTNLFFSGLNSGVHYVIPSNNVDPEPQPTFIEDVPEDQFQVEETTLSAGRGKKSGRTFNSNFVRTIPDTVYHRYFQYNILGTELKFVFERDEYRRLVNVFILNGNKRPGKGRSYVATYVATINGIQFLLHKTGSGYIIGASPPPNQVPITKVANQRPRIEPEGPGPSHKTKKPRTVPPQTHI